MDFNERVIPRISSNFMLQEELSKYEFAKKFIKNNMKIIDLGCGTGFGTAILKNAVGIDINKEAIQFAKKHYVKNAKFLVKDVTNTKFNKESFDLAVSFEVIEHIKNYKKFLKEVQRIIKKNSYFILSTPNTLKSNYNSPYHQKEFTHKELQVLLKTHFRSVKIFGQSTSPKAKKAWEDFMKSQTSRENFVKKDKFAVRKLMPKFFKEKVWSIIGNYYGRKTQENITVKDFPISSKDAQNAMTFIAICKK